MTPEDNAKQQCETQAARIRAPRRALDKAKMHRRAVPLWQDGQFVWVQPDEAELPREEEKRPKKTGACTRLSSRLKIRYAILQPPVGQKAVGFLFLRSPAAAGAVHQP